MAIVARKKKNASAKIGKRDFRKNKRSAADICRRQLQSLADATTKARQLFSKKFALLSRAEKLRPRKTPEEKKSQKISAFTGKSRRSRHLSIRRDCGAFRTITLVNLGVKYLPSSSHPLLRHALRYNLFFSPFPFFPDFLAARARDEIFFQNERARLYDFQGQPLGTRLYIFIKSYAGINGKSRGS